MFFLPLTLLIPPEGAGSLVVDLSLILYSASLLVLLVAASQGLLLFCLSFRCGNALPAPPSILDEHPTVTVQLPIYNERYVVERIIRAVCALEYPREKLQVQVLDDSSDGTVDIVARLVREYREKGVDISQVTRTDRQGYKSGALDIALGEATGEFIAVFDADFVPRQDFLQTTLPLFSDDSTGMIQTRWEHINESYSVLTRTQAFAFDAHFAIEQRVRSATGHLLTFNGTGGIWRKRTIVDAGGWHTDTLTEDLDLSYRAQLRGWKLIFRNDLTSPAELPSDFNSLKAQQYRWTRGYIETARKLLPAVWKSALPLSRKVVSTLHLTTNVAFPFLLLVAILNMPVSLVRMSGSHGALFTFLWIFMAGFVSTFLFYLQSQRVMHKDWLKRMRYYPVFLAGSMGLCVNNTKAVLEGLFAGPGTFFRTPKYAVSANSDTWSEKEYAPRMISKTVVVEILLALYCFFGVVFSLYHLDFSAVPFQLLFTVGFSLVAWMSVRHAWAARTSGRITL